MPPVGALLWAAMGRNPMAGMLAAYASVSGAFASNLLVTSMDVVNMSYTEAAAQLVDPNIVLTPAMNWIFSAVSVVFLTIFSVIITVRVVEPRMGKYAGSYEAEKEEPNPRDGKALKAALVSFLVYIALVVVGVLTGVLCDPETGSAHCLCGTPDEGSDRPDRPDVCRSRHHLRLCLRPLYPTLRTSPNP